MKKSLLAAALSFAILFSPVGQTKVKSAAPPPPSIPNSDYLVGAYFYPVWNLDKRSPLLMHMGWMSIYPFAPRKPYLGYYDDDNPEVWDWQIKWATENGVQFFVFDWMRGDESLGKPIDSTTIPSYATIHKGYFGSKFSDKLKFAIMITDGYPNLEYTDINDFKNNLMPFIINNYFKRANYLVIDNKPVFYIWDNAQGYAKWAEVIPTMRQMVKAAGFTDVILMGNDFLFSAAGTSGIQTLKNAGFDYVSTYVTLLNRLDGQQIPNHPTEEQAMRSQLQSYQFLSQNQILPYIVTASPFWDNYPMHFDLSQLRYYLSGDNYKNLINSLKTYMAQSSGPLGKKMIMVDAWNEFCEGHAIAPNERHGFNYLKAIRESLTKMDNNPDYSRPPSLAGYETKFLDLVTNNNRQYADVKNSLYNINTIDDFINVMDINFPLHTATNLTYGGWLKSTLTGPITTPFGKNPYASVTMSALGGGFCQIMIKNTSGEQKSFVAHWPQGKITKDNWHHLICRYDGSSLSVYIDKVKVGTVAAEPGTIVNERNNINLGYYVTPDKWSPLSVAGFRFENSAFTDAQITDLYNSTKTLITTVPGDLNLSGHVDIFDYSIFVSDYGKTGTPGFVPADINKDGKVDALDYNTLLLNFGK